MHRRHRLRTPPPQAKACRSSTGNPVPLDPVRHAKAGLKEREDFSFARGTNAIAITGAEFAPVARTYPIVFSATAPVVPFAVVGMRDNENLFLDCAGPLARGVVHPGVCASLSLHLRRDRGLVAARAVCR